MQWLQFTTAATTPMKHAGAMCALWFLSASAAAAGIEVTDDTGARLRFAQPPQRIVSLAPGATEMLFAIGAGKQVVGTSRYSEEPAAARQVPVIGDVAGLDFERILLLRPDVIIVWQGGNPAAQVERLQALGLRLYRQRVTRLGALADSLQRLGHLTGHERQAAAAADALSRRLAKLAADHARAQPLRTFLQIWDQPLYTAGGAHFMSDALRYCGAVTVFPELAGDAPAVSIEAVLQRDPDLIVADAPPGRATEWLAAWRRYPRLRAVTSGALIPFEDPRFGMLGPSALTATEKLCRLIASKRAAAPR
jgi:iron complex transport system substrate-binding protein